MEYGDLVSVVVPVFNRAHQISRVIASILAQSYRNIEVVIVDDASTDAIEPAVAALQDPRLRLVRRDRNGGAAAARNTGIAAARADWIAFHDSDDFCTSDRIDLSVRKMCTLPPDYVGVYGSALFYDSGPEETYARRRAFFLPAASEPQLSGDLSTRTEIGNLMNLPTILVRKSALLAAGGFDESLRQNEDWDLCLRLTRQGKFGFVPEFLILCPNPLEASVAADKISRSDRFGARSFVRISVKLRRGGVKGRHMAVHYGSAGRFLIRVGRPKLARRFLRAALAEDAAHPRLWAHFLLSFAPRLHALLRR